eukprot:TRINITY_DN9038_c1_g1_i2.p1 TRINITY_DN9038_c1_g1~~TRINITY_DN9038_c1_g1_i2.p1  ORF type:complete len:1183 (-),score=257.02 TRINITY_DN9038_c1_g1_i2:115-3606(-)
MSFKCIIPTCPRTYSSHDELKRHARRHRSARYCGDCNKVVGKCLSAHKKDKVHVNTVKNNRRRVEAGEDMDSTDEEMFVDLDACFAREDEEGVHHDRPSGEHDDDDDDNDNDDDDEYDADEESDVEDMEDVDHHDHDSHAHDHDHGHDGDEDDDNHEDRHDDEDSSSSSDSGSGTEPESEADDGNEDPLAGLNRRNRRLISAETRKVCKLFRLSALSERQMQRMLRLFLSPKFNRDDCAHTIHELKKAEGLFFNPSLKRYRKKLPSGHSLVFNKPIDIIRFILHQRRDLDNWEWDFELNNGDIAHPKNSGGVFKLLATCHIALENGAKPIWVKIFVDGFQHLRSKQKNTVGIYISFGNEPSATAHKLHNRYLVALAPGCAPLNEVMTEILKHLKPIEDGITCDFRWKGQIIKQRFIGSITTILGDHMGQIALASIKGPRCVAPCRKCKRRREHMASTAPVNYSTLRNSEEQYVQQDRVRQLLQKPPSAEVKRDLAAARELLDHDGLNEEVPALFDQLDLVKTRVLDLMAACFLHLRTLGLDTRYTNNMFRNLMDIDLQCASVDQPLELVHTLLSKINFRRLRLTCLSNIWRKVDKKKKAKYCLSVIQGGDRKVWYRISHQMIYATASLDIQQSWSNNLRSRSILSRRRVNRFHLYEDMEAVRHNDAKMRATLGKNHNFDVPNVCMSANHMEDDILDNSIMMDTTGEHFENYNKVTKGVTKKDNHHDLAANSTKHINLQIQYRLANKSDIHDFAHYKELCDSSDDECVTSSSDDEIEVDTDDLGNTDDEVQVDKTIALPSKYVSCKLDDADLASLARSFYPILNQDDKVKIYRWVKIGEVKVRPILDTVQVGAPQAHRRPNNPRYFEGVTLGRVVHVVSVMCVGGIRCLLIKYQQFVPLTTNAYYKPLDWTEVTLSPHFGYVPVSMVACLREVEELVAHPGRFITSHIFNDDWHPHNPPPTKTPIPQPSSSAHPARVQFLTRAQVARGLDHLPIDNNRGFLRLDGLLPSGMTFVTVGAAMRASLISTFARQDVPLEQELAATDFNVSSSRYVNIVSFMYLFDKYWTVFSFDICNACGDPHAVVECPGCGCAFYCSQSEMTGHRPLHADLCNDICLRKPVRNLVAPTNPLFAGKRLHTYASERRARRDQVVPAVQQAPPPRPVAS